ncbi:MAG: regulatory protein TetR [Frankiales bacterium]|nr:regulatory protein TetR [Frankiales bacterium]
MARPRSIDLDAVLNAALDTFAAQGFKQTLMTDVARHAGVATGSLYNVAASKDALFLAIFLPHEDLERAELPLQAPPRQDMAVRISERLQQATELPLLRAALLKGRTGDIALEIQELVAERFRMLNTHWKLLAAIERTARDNPQIFQAYFREARTEGIDTLAAYLTSRQQGGQIRRLPDSTHAARFIIEAVSWWAWHRHEDPDAGEISDESALQIVQDMISAALIPR